MKMKRLALSGLFAGFAALSVSSCAYDPYYSTSSYSGGYGSGYGYGSSNFSTSFFVSTGNPRWGYDPYSACYYDYTRRSYYDPYLSGYYPIGYRPRHVYGAPHPHGWSRGSGYCPPPTRIRSHTITNCDNRAESYRSLGRDWSRNVQVTAPNDYRRNSYGGRESRQPSIDGSHGSSSTQRYENFSSRTGSFQRDGSSQEGGGIRNRDLSGRGTSSGRGFNPGNDQVTSPQLILPSDREEGHRGGSRYRQQEREGAPMIERPAPQQRIEEPTAPRRDNSPSMQRRESNRDGGSGSDDDSRGGGRGIRSLGEG